MVVRQQVDGALAQAGFDVLQAADGVDALAKLASAPDVALVVCDVNMPQMNGIEFLEKLSADGNKVPVVMLTTEGQRAMIDQACSFGAKGWIVKPFKANLLVAAAKKLTSA